MGKTQEMLGEGGHGCVSSALVPSGDFEVLLEERLCDVC